MAHGQHGLTRDGAISGALLAIDGEIQGNLSKGLYSVALVIIDDVINFDNQAGYQTAVKLAGSGGSDNWLPLDKHEPGYKEALVSHRDSEVASLDDAWDWLTGGGPQHPPQSISVVLVSNIGPCDGCKQRIINFRNYVTQHFPGVSVQVESVYAQAGASSKPGTRGDEKIATTYGYPNIAASQLDGRQVWRHVI
ncbi:MAG TPA: hypothetical protein VK586_08590 [Streptosporangiaceae bacterium]|nr:hypothetical protein [Streptosporangiaceae bacterium]